MSIKYARYAVFAVTVLFAGAISAAPITFNFVYNTPTNVNASPASKSSRIVGDSTAQEASITPLISGSITFESTLLPNPGSDFFDLPASAVLALDVTVTGATSGNGHFTLADFSGITYNTGGGTLNFAQQLVGQAIPGGTWGDPSLENADFNLFNSAPTAPTAPDGEWFFTLCTNGGNGDCAQLTSMIQAGAGSVGTVPALNPWMLALLGLILTAAATWTLRRAGSVR
jgi:hypothetical protein